MQQWRYLYGSLRKIFKMHSNEKFLSSVAVQNQLLLDEIAIQAARYKNLVSALRNYVAEAHYGCLEGITECDHGSGICYCGYHAALSKAENLLR